MTRSGAEGPLTSIGAQGDSERLGDSIMCARYIPLLANRGARIIVASNPTLAPFFARIPGIETLLSPPPDQPLAQINLTALPFDAWLPGLSLPHWFGTDLSNVPAHGPYWSVDASRIAAWRSRLAAAGRPGAAKIGLVFQANPEGAGFSDKSMQLGDIAPLLALEGIDIVNLQYGAAGRTLAAASAPQVSMRVQDLTPLVQLEGIDLVNLQSSSEGRELARFAADAIDPLQAPLTLDEFTATLAATNVTVSVDTMAAHCAGALGRPVLVMLTDAPAWYWGVGGDKCRWYPSARLFRRSAGAVWAYRRRSRGRRVARRQDRAAFDLRSRRRVANKNTEIMLCEEHPDWTASTASMKPPLCSPRRYRLFQCAHGEKAKSQLSDGN